MGCMIAIQMNEALMINVLFPFLVFMTEFFGYKGASLGIHAGIIASSFCGAQFLSSMLWGRLSDQVGLKPCLIAGTLGSSLMFIQFGLSRNFGQAVAARACAGLLNGNSGLLKCYIAKVTDQSNRAKGFSFISLAWGKSDPPISYPRTAVYISMAIQFDAAIGLWTSVLLLLFQAWEPALPQCLGAYFALPQRHGQRPLRAHYSKKIPFSYHARLLVPGVYSHRW